MPNSSSFHYAIGDTTWEELTSQTDEPPTVTYLQVLYPVENADILTYFRSKFGLASLVGI